MKYLLDTHTLLWALNAPEKLDDVVRTIISNDDNEIFYSIVTPWEIEIKHNKHPKEMPITGTVLIQSLQDYGITLLNIKPKHIEALASLNEKENNKHSDPFDRMLLAQAKSECIPLITHDKQFRNYDELYLLRF